MKPVGFHPDAASEMTLAAAYYEVQQPDLGRRFLASVQDAVNRIRVNPHIYPIVEPDVRRCLTKTFPFGVLFRERPGQIVIMAVMHLQRDPDCWKNR
jgi:plasmid stabilization system protein ParE